MKKRANQNANRSANQTAMFNRRQLLNATGLATGSLFLPSLMSDRAAYAAGESKRIVFFITNHGPGRENWSMTRPNLPTGAATEWEFDLAATPEAEYSTVLKPLYAHRQDLLVLDGLAMTSCCADNPGTNAHNAGTSHLLTGAKMVRMAGFNNEGQGGARSVDRLIADKVKEVGKIDELLYSSRFHRFPFSFQGANDPTVAEYSPQAAFDRLFPAGQAPKPGAPDDAEKIRLARPGVLDQVRGRYDKLAKVLGSEDRRRIENHRNMIADLEAQLKARATNTMVCQAPPRTNVTGTSGGTSDTIVADKIFSELMAVAMGCGLTRVGAIVTNQLALAAFGAPSTYEDVHQKIAHASNNAGNAESVWMGKYYERHAREFAYLIDLFKTAGMLQTTTLVWLNELANGPHDYNGIMAVIAGQGGGAFKTGRYVKYKTDGANPATFGFSGGKSPLGPAHSKLLVSFMQAMGVDSNAIGIETATGYNVKRGEAIDLKGPLPRLT